MDTYINFSGSDDEDDTERPPPEAAGSKVEPTRSSNPNDKKVGMPQWKPPRHISFETI